VNATVRDRGRNDTEAGAVRSDVHRSRCSATRRSPYPWSSLPPPRAHQPPLQRRNLVPLPIIRSPTPYHLSIRRRAHRVYIARRGIVSFRRTTTTTTTTTLSQFGERSYGESWRSAGGRTRDVSESIVAYPPRHWLTETNLPACLPACLSGFLWLSINFINKSRTCFPHFPPLPLAYCSVKYERV